MTDRTWISAALLLIAPAAHADVCDELLARTNLSANAVTRLVENSEVRPRVFMRMVDGRPQTVVVLATGRSAAYVRSIANVTHAFRRIGTNNGVHHPDLRYVYPAQRWIDLLNQPYRVCRALMSADIEPWVAHLNARSDCRVGNLEQHHQPSRREQRNALGRAAASGVMVSFVMNEVMWHSLPYDGATAMFVLAGGFGAGLLATPVIEDYAPRFAHLWTRVVERDQTMARRLDYAADADEPYLALIAPMHVPGVCRQLSQRYGFAEIELNAGQ